MVRSLAPPSLLPRPLADQQCPRQCDLNWDLTWGLTCLLKTEVPGLDCPPAGLGRPCRLGCPQVLVLPISCPWLQRCWGRRSRFLSSQVRALQAGARQVGKLLVGALRLEAPRFDDLVLQQPLGALLGAPSGARARVGARIWLSLLGLVQGLESAQPKLWSWLDGAPLAWGFGPPGWPVPRR